MKTHAFYISLLIATAACVLIREQHWNEESERWIVLIRDYHAAALAAQHVAQEMEKQRDDLLEVVKKIN